jgi:hypothetical protein
MDEEKISSFDADHRAAKGIPLKLQCFWAVQRVQWGSGPRLPEP